jgi:8-oxo-dGTP diphosphatase
MQPLAFASHAYEDFHLLMPLFVCRRWDGLVSPREGQALHWARPRDLRKFPMPPADAPLIDPLIALLG